MVEKSGVEKFMVEMSGVEMSFTILSSFTPFCYTRAGDPRNHPVIYGNMYFWQLRYHAKIATPLWGIHKLRSKKYSDRVRLDNSLIR